MDGELEDDLYDTKLLQPDGDQSTSTSEITEGLPVNTEFPSAEDAEITEKDGCWAWVVCGAAFCDLFVVLGMHYTVGVLYAALLDHFKESKAKTGTYILKYIFFVVHLHCTVFIMLADVINRRVKAVM